MNPTTLFTLTLLTTLTTAHGYFQSPQGRQPGPAFKSACGEQAYNMLSSDINGNIQGLQSLTSNQPDYSPSLCHFWTCKGLKFDDNTAAIQTYTPGQEVPLYFHIAAPHSGVANVSVIDLGSGGVVGEAMRSWDEYAMTSLPMEEGWQNFTVVMPTGLGGKCVEEGACAIQMHWDAASVNQTYQSCIDFTMAESTSKRSHVRDFS